jgi:4'-phosphopantetheinyl transferase
MIVNNDLPQLWQLANPDTMLPEDKVHVWRGVLEQPPARVESLLRVLSDDERGRAERYVFQKDGQHFIVCRAMLRHILGRYLKMDPGQISFLYSHFGKPYLAEKQNGMFVRFNISHSGELALVAVTRNRELGVDIDRIRPDDWRMESPKGSSRHLK